MTKVTSRTRNTLMPRLSTIDDAAAQAADGAAGARVEQVGDQSDRDAASTLQIR